MESLYNKSYRSIYNLTAHLVFVTKYRKKVLTDELLTELEKAFSSILKARKCQLIEFNGESDHVHLLVDVPPDLAPSKLVNTLKTISSRSIRKEYAAHVAKFYRKPVFWTGAYCVISAGGAPLEVLKQYIQNQDSPE